MIPQQGHVEIHITNSSNCGSHKLTRKEHRRRQVQVHLWDKTIYNRRIACCSTRSRRSGNIDGWSRRFRPLKEWPSMSLWIRIWKGFFTIESISQIAQYLSWEVGREIEGSWCDCYSYRPSWRGYRSSPCNS